jgi:hypothetical protein
MPRWMLIPLLIASFVTAAEAQGRGGFGGFHGGFRSGARFAGYSSRGHGRTNAVSFGDPFFYSDYPSQPVIYERPVSPVVVVQPSSTAAPAEGKPEPLMIEWQGDKYVRYSGQRESAKSLDYSDSVSNRSSTRAQLHPAQAAHVDLPPVVLVYPDGHREQVSDYVIANGNLYARGDYWRDGFWEKTIQLSALDIPATLRTNSQSGANFVLPTGPNEVITRP